MAAIAGRHSALAHCLTVGSQTGVRLDAMLRRQAEARAAPADGGAEEVRALLDDPPPHPTALLLLGLVRALDFHTVWHSVTSPQLAT